MEPTNFENNIRQKLEEREIQPSSQAWSKLEAMLPQQETKKRPSVWWYAVAAALVGVLLTVSLLNNTPSTRVDAPMATEEIESKAVPTISVETNNNTDIALEEEMVSIEKTENLKTQTTIQNKKEEASKISKLTNTAPETSIALQEPEKIEKVINEQIIFNNQLNKVVAQVQELQQKNDTVTVSEVEILLAVAQKEINSQRILSSSKVDPIALLGDVEYEIDRSFRDRVFLALGDGFDAVKGAILDRNN